MITRPYFSYVVYLFALIGLLSVVQFIYRNELDFLPVFIPTYTHHHRHPNRSSNKAVLPYSNLLLQHIQQCPECLLFLLTNQTPGVKQKVFSVFNRIPSASQARFYPLTMKLLYNQPIPFYTILADDPTETTRRVRQFWIDQIEKVKDIDRDSLLHSILQSMRQPIKTISQPWPNRTKLVLYYTKFFGSTYWYNKDRQAVYTDDLGVDSCPLSVNACHVTTDHQLFAQSDASLIHLRESINWQKLKSLPRQADQRFVFFLKESPVHSPTLSAKEHGQLFNYTQTYRPDSDVTATTLRDLFWLFDHKVYPDYDFQSILQTKQSGKLLVAIVSNCGGSSNRLKYINELKQFISVDVYGNCGKSCPQASDCRQYAYSTYKFYLAFENSLCDEYVTEKFFFALHSARIVPVVLGWARYEHYIPSTGYIDVRNFTSPRDLADYIRYLDKNTTAYLEYFQWRQYAVHIKLPKYICELCLKLFLDDREQNTQSLSRIDQYWNKKTQCHRYEKDSTGAWIMT